MLNDSKTDDVEKFLSEQKSLEDRKQALIQDLLRQKDEAIKAFDERLVKLGYSPRNNAGRPKRSHHRQGQPSADVHAKTGVKPKE